MPQVVLTAPVDRQVLTIPSTALVFQEHGTQVAVVTDDDRVHFKPIHVSRLLDNTVEVAEGISTSDRIVNNPSAALLEGDKVRVVTPAPGYDLGGTEASAPEDHRLRSNYRRNNRQSHRRFCHDRLPHANESGYDV